MFIRKCSNILIVSLIVASASSLLAQGKATPKAQTSAADKNEPSAPTSPKTAEPVSAQPSVSSTQPQLPAPSVPAESLNKVESTVEAPKAKVSSAQVGEKSAPEPALTSVQQPPTSPSPVLSSKEPTEPPQSTRFLERIKGPNAKPNPPTIAPAPPRPVRSAGSSLALAIVFERSWANDRGYDVFGDRSRVRQVGLWVAHDIWSISQRVIVAAEAGWVGWDETSDYLDTDVETKLTTGSLHVGANIRYTLEPWLQPHLRLAVGVSFLEMKIESIEDSSAATFSDRRVLPFGSLGGGLFLRTPTRLFENKRGNFASLSLGVLVEGGYTLAGAASFSLKPKEHSKEDIEINSADLGKLNRSGGYVRISLVVRF
jgi:hypothetical protein